MTVADMVAKGKVGDAKSYSKPNQRESVAVGRLGIEQHGLDFVDSFLPCYDGFPQSCEGGWSLKAEWALRESKIFFTGMKSKAHIRNAQLSRKNR